MGRGTRRRRPAPVLVRSLVLLAVLAVAAAVSVLPGTGSGEPSRGPSGGDAASAGAADPYDPGLSLVRGGERKRRAAQITSTFENATLELQYGSGGEHGTWSIIAEATGAVGTAHGNEPAWLHALLDVRLRHLLRSYEGAGADAASRSRIGALRSLVEDGELALQPPVSWTVYGTAFTVRE